MGKQLHVIHERCVVGKSILRRQRNGADRGTSGSHGVARAPQTFGLTTIKSMEIGYGNLF